MIWKKQIELLRHYNIKYMLCLKSQWSLIKILWEDRRSSRLTKYLKTEVTTKTRSGRKILILLMVMFEIYEASSLHWHVILYIEENLLGSPLELPAKLCCGCFFRFLTMLTSKRDLLFCLNHIIKKKKYTSGKFHMC